MNARVRFAAWILWIAPFAALAALIGWETGWGNAIKRLPGPARAIAPTPVAVSLLPDYAVPPAEARRETVERTLFNPTRRPAPAQTVADASKQRMQRGQFTLAGTTLAGNKTIAFLRETQGGKPRTARQGETINGMLVAEVKPDRVKLTLGDESEEVLLRVAAGPRTTVQPVVAPPASQAGVGAPPAARGQPVAAQVTEADVAARLAERRRAARAAQEAAQAGAPSTVVAPTPVPAAPSTAPSAPARPSGSSSTQPDPRWSEVYQRYQNRTPR